MDAFRVEPELLRRSALAIEPLGARVTEAGVGPQRAAAQAVGTNTGYLTAAAIEQLTTLLERNLSLLAESLTQHGGGLANCAVTYEHTDSRVEWSLGVLRRKLGAD